MIITAKITEDELEMGGPNEQKRVRGTVTVEVDVDYTFFFGDFHVQNEEDQLEVMKKNIYDQILRKFK